MTVAGYPDLTFSDRLVLFLPKVCVKALPQSASNPDVAPIYIFALSPRSLLTSKSRPSDLALLFWHNYISLVHGLTGDGIAWTLEFEGHYARFP